MNDNSPTPPKLQTQPPGGLIPTAPAAEDEINFRELFDILWSGKWVVLAITLAALVLSVVYALTAAPVYQASGLVQVEKEQDSLTSSVNQLSSLIGAGPAEAPAEIAILKSGMVLGSVIDHLKLYIRVQPNYLPIFGEAIARRRGDEGFSAEPLFRSPLRFLNRFAWGGEKIRVTAFEAPPSLHNQPFILQARGESSYDLKDGEGRLLLTGTAGERASATTPQGSLEIFVQELAARPGTQFHLQRLALQSILSETSGRLTAVEQPRDSGVISLMVEAEDPQFAAQLLNEIQDAYLRQNVERRSAQAAQSLEFLKKQLPELRANVDKAQAELNAYQLKKGTVDVQQETQLLLQQVVELETTRLKLSQERDAALQRFTAEHPVVVTVGEQIRGIESEQAKLKKQIENLPETQQEILSLMRDLEVNTGLYTALLNSVQELQVTKAGTVGNVRIIDRALPPLAPIKPRKKLIVALGLLLGGFVGVLTVFGLRALMRGVDRPEEVERAIGLPTYASIPYSLAQKRIVRRLQRSTAGENLILASLDPTDLAVEALRSLRTSLHFAMLEASNNIVMFTGPVVALGKSFMTINLGAVLAMSGKSVMVLDADMRRGRLHRYVGVKQAPGLSDYIARSAEDVAIIQQTKVPGLFFIPSGSRPPNPAEILLSERFNELLNTLSARYDYVLIDTPPALPVADASIIGRLAGTTLIVLKSAEHPMRAIEETVKRLRQAGVAVRGMIFNQVGARIGSYGYGAYGYSYGYSSYGYRSAGSKD